MEYFVYILHSAKLNKHYIGFTTDINIRMSFHEDAEARKFTAKAEDWKLVFSMLCNSKIQALAIEKHIKSMKSKIYIQNLIKYPEIEQNLRQKYT